MKAMRSWSESEVVCLHHLGTKAMRDASSGPTPCMYRVSSSVSDAICTGATTRISSKRCQVQQTTTKR